MSDDFNNSRSDSTPSSTSFEGSGYDPLGVRSGSQAGENNTETAGTSHSGSDSPSQSAWSAASNENNTETAGTVHSSSDFSHQNTWSASSGGQAGWQSPSSSGGGWQAPIPPRQPEADNWSFTQYEDSTQQAVPGGGGPRDPYVTVQNPVGGPGGPRKPKKNRGLKIFGMVAGVILLIGLVTFASYGAYFMFSGSHIQSSDSLSGGGQQSSSGSLPNIGLESKPVSDSSTASPDGVLTTNQIYKKVSPAVVGIINYQVNGSDFLGGRAAAGEGSGVVMTEDGYILTNAHVVSGAAGIKVVLSNGDQYEARVVGADVKTDLAVIKIDATGLQYASFGNSDEIEIGELAVAIGNPGGQIFANSISQGCISGINRQITTEDGYTITCIQTDAAINPGNSGGALVNQYGQVIGINSSKIVAEGYEGLGFAIPTNTAIPIAQDLIANGRVTGRAVLGITVQMVDSATAQYYSVPTGLLVLSTQENSDISRKGVVPGDIITSVNGTNLTSTNDLYKILNEKVPGDTLELTIFRRTTGQEDRTFSVTVALIEENASNG